MSRFARTAITVSMIAFGALVVPVPAQATSALLGPVLGPLPASASGGGPGTPALNGLVSRTCYGGAALGAPAWFTLPSGDLNTVIVRGQEIQDVPSGKGSDYPFMSGRVALVDYLHGRVLSCYGGPAAVAASTPTAAVVWISTGDLNIYRSECSYSAWFCGQPPTRVHVQQLSTAAVPDNDAMAAARPITSVPFSTDGNSALATSDGPQFPPQGCSVSEFRPIDYGTVWWRWTASYTGPLIYAIDDQVPGRRMVIARVTPDGAVPLDRPREEAMGCPTGDYSVVAGQSYLIGVSVMVDYYYDGVPIETGGPYRFYLGAPGAPLAVDLVASSSGSDSVALTWTASGTPPGGSSVTSFRVTRDGRSAAGVGSTTVTLPAGARSYTFTGLQRGRPTTSVSRR